MNRELAVHKAAAALVEAFASNSTERYFDCFTPDATFIFHTVPQPLLSRQAYQDLWQTWQAEGFIVLACVSSNAKVSLQGDVAIFIHDVATHIRVGGEALQLQERETIVFTLHDERWLACHEHLSAISA